MENNVSVLKEAKQLAEQLFTSGSKKRARFTARLLDTCSRAQGKQFLLIHNPGGWGTTRLENCLPWEKSIVEGVSASIKRSGCSSLLIQYFRTGNGWGEFLQDIKEQARFFTHKARIMASELEFITRHLTGLKVILIGVSQGAAFSNAVLQHSRKSDQIYSIELGLPFFYRSRRVITERILPINSNGSVPDALMEWDIKTIIRTYLTAPWRWAKYRWQGKEVSFAGCINVPGHDYSWEYPEVQRQIEDFIKINFGDKSNVEVDL